VCDDAFDDIPYTTRTLKSVHSVPLHRPVIHPSPRSPEEKKKDLFNHFTDSRPRSNPVGCLVVSVLLGEHKILLEPVLLLGSDLSGSGSLLTLDLNSLRLVRSELVGDAGVGGLGERGRSGGRPLLDRLGGSGEALGLGLVVAQLAEVDVHDGVRGHRLAGVRNIVADELRQWRSAP
jgi:hypothetical protein